MNIDIAIRDFIFGQVEDIKTLCFFLAHEMDERYAFKHLSPGRLEDQSQEVVGIAARNKEIEKLMVYLWRYWVEDRKNNVQVLIDTGMSSKLCLAAQVLWGRERKRDDDRALAERAFEDLAKVTPDFQKVWKPENLTNVIFDPPREAEEFTVHLAQCEALLQQVNDHVQQHCWKEAWDSLSQLHSLQPGYGNFSWESDQENDFIGLQKVWDAASSGFVYEEALSQQDPSPYVLFRNMKKAITPASSMEEVQTELRQLKDVSGATRASLESLGKTEEERLFVDLFLYPRYPTQDIALGVEQAFLTSGKLPTPDEIKTQYPDTAGELLILLGYPEQAAAFWQTAQCEAPLEGRWAHSLGLLYLGLSQTASEMAVENWQRTIAQWAMSLTDITYWIAWGRERFKAYGRSFVFSTISNLVARLPNDLSRLLERSQWEREPAEKTQTIATLQRELLVEFDTIRLMQSIGNIPLAPGRLIRFGPLWLKHFGAELNAQAAIAQFMRDVRIDDIQPNALMGFQSPEDILQKLRWLFSELSWAASLLDNDPELALDSLHKHPDPSSWENNPAYELLPDRAAKLSEDKLQLEFHAHLRLIAKLLKQSTSTAVEIFQTEWQEIAQLIEKSREKEKSRARLRKFVEDTSHPSQATVERLNGVITFLEAYLAATDAQSLPNIVALDEILIKKRLASWLKLRATNRLNEGDTPGAEADLKRALEYDPYDFESRALLATMWCNLIVTIDDRFLALDYLQRAKRLILEGKEKSPGFNFDTLLEEIEKGLARFAKRDQAHPIFADPEEAQASPEPLLPSSQEPQVFPENNGPSEVLKLYRKAIQEKLSGRLAEALQTLEKALGSDPQDVDLQALAAETVTTLAARLVEQKKMSEEKKLMSEWLKRLPLHAERLQRRAAFLNVWGEGLKARLDTFGNLVVYRLRDYEFLEFPFEGQKVPSLTIVGRVKEDDLQLSVSLPIIPASNEETVLSNLLQATRETPIFKLACPRNLDFQLLGQVPLEMLDAAWLVLLILELDNYADISQPELLQLDSVQNWFRESYQQMTQEFKTQEYLSASSKAVERLCQIRRFGYERLTEARFDIDAFSKVTMEASKDNIRLSTLLHEIDLARYPNPLAVLQKCAELNYGLRWCKLTLNAAKQIVLSLELPYVEDVYTLQAFDQLEQTWHQVKDALAEIKEEQ